MNNSNCFEVLHKDKYTSARLGKLKTYHGEITTPVFMPVGTQASVKTLSPQDLKDNDVEIILPSVTEKNKGIAVIGGTGCNFYGMNKNKEAYASGLNCFISDEGSGFDIGLKVLRAAVRSFDGRGQKTILESLVKEKANIKNIRDLVDVVYAKDFEKTTIAWFAPLAEKAADKGDKIAKQILISAAGEYILGIKAVANKVGLKDKEFVIAFVGSTVNSKYIFPNIKDKIKKLFPKAILKKVENPAFGAAKLAMNYYIKNREGF